MEQKVFHGSLSPDDIAQALLAEFSSGNMRAQVFGEGDKLAVQIGTRPGAPSGGRTGLAVTLQKVADGVLIQLGSQEWLGTAASLGRTTISALANPWSLLGRLDDIAQDVENLQLSERVWQVIDRSARALGAGQELSERLRRLACEYCGTANPVGEPACIACGAPLGKGQPQTCPNCGFIAPPDAVQCPNCGHKLGLTSQKGS
jgi:DNA-directed RNA polymerase subunit RPC12/RpoP